MRLAVRIYGVIGVLVALAATPGASRALASGNPAAKQPRTNGNAIDRWNQMSPEERERELAKLPPERARIIRERIRRYNQLPPAQKQALRERYRRFRELPPEKQDLVRERMREFRRLPLARRPVLRRELDRIRALPEPERQAQLNSQEFRSRFSPPEQAIIRDMVEIFPVPIK